MNQGRHRGFTLIELIMVIAILGIIATIAGPLIYHLTLSATQQYEISSVSGQGRIALEQMASELRMIRSNAASDLSVMNAQQITFVRLDGQSVTYSLSGQQLLRSGVPLAKNVTALNFTYQNQNGLATAVSTSVCYITIRMTITEGNTSETMYQVVFLRDIL